jgi:hypothetical protein
MTSILSSGNYYDSVRLDVIFVFVLLYLSDLSCSLKVGSRLSLSENRVA